MPFSLTRILFGRALANREVQEREIGVVEGVPAMGLDALSSASYGPEAALAILAPVGAAALSFVTPLMAAIICLLAILYVSYRQTMRAYPGSGGAYQVVKANLGAGASVLAAAALMVDYVLNVAVGISAGIAALVSVAPALFPHTLLLCLAALLLIVLANLRGTMDAGRLFALPTYLFVASFLFVIGFGIAKALAAGGDPRPLIAPAPLATSGEAVGAWLLLRAFASGCTAMTGVEAVSNGMSAFKKPIVPRAHATLSVIVGALAVLLAGIAWLAHTYHIGAMDQTKAGYRSVLSQLAGAVLGNGTLYYIALSSALAVLVLSANTSFTGFPRLCRLVAQDGYLPHPFSVAGRRLVFTVGIFYLAGTAAGLLIVFGGITDRLIPLFAIGAFLTFTLSQAGMTLHWRNARCGGDRSFGTRVRMTINGVGALATAIALLVIIAAKFVEGAWIVVVVVPCVIATLLGIRRYYDRLYASIRANDSLAVDCRPAVALVAMEGWSRPVKDALALALRLSPDIVGVHLTDVEGPSREDGLALNESWRKNVEEPARAAGLKPPRLFVLPAPYRRLDIPFLKFIDQLEPRVGDRPVAVLIPQLVKRRWWQHLLHSHRAARLRSELLRYGGSRLIVIDVPWYLEEPNPEELRKAESSENA
ncbi:MAG TPA: amino acid permease [Rhizomicrobium sp.]|jgi:amino acid transporter